MDLGVCIEWANMFSLCGGVGILLEKCTLPFCNKLYCQHCGVRREVLVIAERLFVYLGFMHADCMGFRSCSGLRLYPAGENGSCPTDYSSWQNIFLKYRAQYCLYNYTTYEIPRCSPLQTLCNHDIPFTDPLSWAYVPT